MLSANQYDFELPQSLIAQTARPRGASRLLVLPPKPEGIQHAQFRALPSFFKPGDCLVVNDTKVIPARLFAEKEDSGARIEIFLLQKIEHGIWEALARPCRRLREGMHLKIGPHFLTVLTILGQGKVRIGFSPSISDERLMQRHGVTPLPPYIRRLREAGQDPKDRRRYQTVFAAHAGSVAAPTAGLHFSPGVIRALHAKGVEVVAVTLHVGWGTFAPLPEGSLEGHQLHAERYEVTPAAAARINQCHGLGGRIVACGTTVARTLETVAAPGGGITAGQGETRLFIYPGYAWKTVKGLLTNFHLPRSSLLMLTAALGGTERVLGAYQEAVEQRYRFYSYGDAMLLLA